MSSGPKRSSTSMRLRGASPAVAVTSGGLRLSAFASMAQVADDPNIRRDYPVIAQSLVLAASAQLRNMATLGGNVLQRTRCNYFRDPSWTDLQQARARKRLRGARWRQPQARGARHERSLHRDLSGRFRASACRARRHRRDDRAWRAAGDEIRGAPPIARGYSANGNELGARRVDHRFHRAAHFMGAALALSQDPRSGVLRIRARFGGRCARHGQKNGEGSAHRAGRHRDETVARPGGGTGACRQSHE